MKNLDFDFLRWGKESKKKVDEQLLKTQIKLERQQLKFISKRIDKIQPFSACGYFDIGKGTLTSMLSLRWGKNKEFTITGPIVSSPRNGLCTTFRLTTRNLLSLQSM